MEVEEKVVDSGDFSRVRAGTRRRWIRPPGRNENGEGARAIQSGVCVSLPSGSEVAGLVVKFSLMGQVLCRKE